MLPLLTKLFFASIQQCFSFIKHFYIESDTEIFHCFICHSGLVYIFLLIACFTLYLVCLSWPVMMFSTDYIICGVSIWFTICWLTCISGWLFDAKDCVIIQILHWKFGSPWLYSELCMQCVNMYTYSDKFVDLLYQKYHLIKNSQLITIISPYKRPVGHY